MSESKALLRELPSLDHLLKHRRAERLLSELNRDFVTSRGREVLDELRQGILRGHLAGSDLNEDAILDRLEQKIDSERQPSLRRVVNATGTILHTNLGRALLSEAAIDAVTTAARHPVTLEFDLGRGGRGRREHVIGQVLCDLTGSEAATVVNNNAAAVLVALNTLANGKNVIVSRGELIEIGGAFRIPEIMAKSGAILREVGTTNRTHPEDYASAIDEDTALLLKVHTSNYRIVGFSSEVPLPDLVAIGTQHHVPVMEDLGSGALFDLSRYGLPKEPIVSERIKMGADIVTFSGDKVLGGPQAGLIVGKKRIVDEIIRNPLHRALRCGKLTIAALEATLKLVQQSADITGEIPTLRAFTRPLQQLEEMGLRLVSALQSALGEEYVLSLEDSTAQIGSGALPTEEIPTKVIAVRHRRFDADRIAENFRRARVPIIGRVKDNRFLLDLRTVQSAEDLIPTWQ